MSHRLSRALGALVCVLLAIPGHAHAASTPQPTPAPHSEAPRTPLHHAVGKSALLPWYGDYLESSYQAVLLATRSPAAAARADHAAGIAQMLTVAPQRDGRRLVLTYDFQRMQAILLLQRDGVVRRELAWGSVPDMALRLVDAQTICLTAPRGGEHCYHRAGDGPAAIARIALAGTYADGQGALYRFNADGTAHLPQRDVGYALLLDETRQGDLLQIGVNGPILAYRHEAAGLALYPVTASRGTQYGRPDYSRKIASLHHAALALASSAH